MMEPSLQVIKARHISGHKLKAWFSNGEQRTIDLSDCLNGPVFEPLKDIDFFKKFTIRFNTIEWENGADFATEYLYGLSGNTRD